MNGPHDVHAHLSTYVHGVARSFIVVAYAPTEQADTQTKDAFYDQLSAALSSAPPHDEVFILGDLNAVTGSDHTLYPGAVGRYGSGASLNDNSDRMLSFCSAHGLAALEFTVGIFFDFARAFDRVWIDGLLMNLRHSGSKAIAEIYRKLS